jgi:predicted HAD superfamily Cof-like phosphohydrolase
MNKMQEQVEDFHRAMEIPIGRDPLLLTGDRARLRISLINEEADEFAHALLNEDMLEQIDALCDLLYVTFGAAVELGVDLEPFFDEVQKANMAKVGGVKRADGKQLKPEGWLPPNHKMIFALLYEGTIPGHR